MELVAKGIKVFSNNLFLIKIIDIGLNLKSKTLYIVYKVVELVTKAQKSLVTMIKLPSFVIKIIDIGLNH